MKLRLEQIPLHVLISVYIQKIINCHHPQEHSVLPFLCPQLFNIGVEDVEFGVDVDSEGGECVLDVGEDSCQFTGEALRQGKYWKTLFQSLLVGGRERELVGAAAVGLGPGSSAAFLFIFFLFPVVHHRPFSYSIAK